MIHFIQYSPLREAGIGQAESVAAAMMLSGAGPDLIARFGAKFMMNQMGKVGLCRRFEADPVRHLCFERV